MNPSLAILQKLQNQFAQGISNKNDYHVAFAPFAFSLTNEDFFFLKNELNTGSETRKFYAEQFEFSQIANSILKKPFIWTPDSEKLLYNLYKNILQQAATIDPDFFTPEEQFKIDEAKKILYNPAGDAYSEKYLKYKEYAQAHTQIEQKIINLNLLRSNLQTQAEIENWKFEHDNLQKEKLSHTIDWQELGAKTIIESALTTYNSIYFSKTSFLEKWKNNRENLLSGPYVVTDKSIDFLYTSCIPNGICEIQSPIWKKLTISKQEIKTLSEEYAIGKPAEVINEFKDADIQLESITFEYCILDILRPWFDESVLNNNFWKFRDNQRILSKGDEGMTGEIPAYPVKIILSKNMELEFTPQVQKNEEIKNKLMNGDRVFFGSLMLKTIPKNLANEKIKTYRVQQMSAKQLSLLTNVASPNLTRSPVKKVNSKFQMLQLINKMPQSKMKNAIEVNSVKPPVAKATFSTFAVKSNTAELSRKNQRISARIGTRPNEIVSARKKPSSTLTFSISGKILDFENKPVGVAEIQFMNFQNASNQSVLSEADGSYRFENVEKGIYQITVNKSGYFPNEDKERVNINENTKLDFLLKSKPLETESFDVLGVICKKLPKLPNPIEGAKYI